jgi:hypothetical protein
MATTKRIFTQAGCVGCMTKLMYVEFYDQATHQAVRNTDCIKDGNAFEIMGGYGSKFDGELFQAVICDHCLEVCINAKEIIKLNTDKEGI